MKSKTLGVIIEIVIFLIVCNLIRLEIKHSDKPRFERFNRFMRLK